LSDSQLLLQLSTPLPRKMFGKEEGKVTKEYEDENLPTAASRILLSFLSSLLHSGSLRATSKKFHEFYTKIARITFFASFSCRKFSLVLRGGVHFPVGLDELFGESMFSSRKTS
jgi:hypothetical protein